MWDRIKRALGRKPRVKWIEAADNPWGVRVLDVRPVTQTAQLVSTDRQCAENAVSFSRDDGTSFIGEEPPVARTVEADLRYPVDRLLADGVLYVPYDMDNLRALFFHNGQIIVVDSWTRKVQALARVEAQQDQILVTAVHGVFTAEDEDPQFTVRVLDYLLRSHALGVAFPAPLPAAKEKNPDEAANWCMSAFGNLAHYATPHRIAWENPARPLRTLSMLHIATARGDIPGIEARLEAGVPIDIRTKDGQAPLHWSLVVEGTAVMRHLIGRGSPVDLRTDAGVTPLMDAARMGSADKASLLLDHGADVNACDRLGYTALHRCAEAGHLDVAKLLLRSGASASVEAEGHTPRSLAEARGHTELATALRDYE